MSVVSKTKTSLLALAVCFSLTLSAPSSAKAVDISSFLYIYTICDIFLETHTVEDLITEEHHQFAEFCFGFDYPVRTTPWPTATIER